MSGSSATAEDAGLSEGGAPRKQKRQLEAGVTWKNRSDIQEILYDNSKHLPRGICLWAIVLQTSRTALLDVNSFHGVH
jgi:hypothetical protein